MLLINGKLYLKFTDIFFVYLTKLGEIPAILGIIIYTWFKKKEWILFVILAIILNTLIVQLLKFGFNLDRPVVALGTNFRVIEGIAIAAKHSFPSGHTAATFLALGIFASLNKFKYVQFFLLIVAFLVGYSRMYLGMHFMQDVGVGILISMFVLIVLKFAIQVKVK